MGGRSDEIDVVETHRAGPAARNRPMIERMSVVLPAPFLPITPAIFPVGNAEADAAQDADRADRDVEALDVKHWPPSRARLAARDRR